MVQHFTELGLDVRKARISSDGGWFVDCFEVQEANGKPVTSQSKLHSIRQVPPTLLAARTKYRPRSLWVSSRPVRPFRQPFVLCHYELA